MALLKVRVTPRSSQTKLQWDGQTLRAWTTASPTDGQANESIRKLLAETFGLAPSKVHLHRGAQSRDKQFELEGLSELEVTRILEALL
ncbi:MAG TPA: DUF167 domain-containing protein [Fimbriimonas sp.]|nr:DUF167 domain-containing protein [Fimbriimonas sp.]